MRIERIASGSGKLCYQPGNRRNQISGMGTAQSHGPYQKWTVNLPSVSIRRDRTLVNILESLTGHSYAIASGGLNAEAASAAAKSIRKSSICLPDLSSAVSHRGRLPRPAHVSVGRAKDCGILARPEDKADVPRPRLLAPFETPAERYWLLG